MAAGTGMGIAVTTVTEDAQAPLGFIHTEPASLNQGLTAQGEKTWIYVRAGVALTAGAVCIRQDSASGNNGNYGNPDSEATPPVPPDGVIPSTGAVAVDRVVGAAQHTIALGSYGFIQRSGIATVTDDGTMAVDLGITPVAAGEAATVAVGTESFGLCLVQGGAGGAATAMIHCTG